MKFEQFKCKLKERSTDDGYIKEGYLLCVDGNIVNYFHISVDKNNDEFIFVDYVTHHLSDNIYEFEVNDNRDYRIEWFVLENDDE